MFGINQAGPDYSWAGDHDESRLQRSDGYSGLEPRALPWAGMNDAFGVRIQASWGGRLKPLRGSRLLGSGALAWDPKTEHAIGLDVQLNSRPGECQGRIHRNNRLGVLQRVHRPGHVCMERAKLSRRSG